MTGTLAATSRENLPTEQPPAKLQRTEAEPKLLVKRLSEHATLPKRGSAGAAGYDLARCACKAAAAGCLAGWLGRAAPRRLLRDARQLRTPLLARPRPPLTPPRAACAPSRPRMQR